MKYYTCSGKDDDLHTTTSVIVLEHLKLDDEVICLIYFQKLRFVAQFNILLQGVCVNGNYLSNIFSKNFDLLPNLMFCCKVFVSMAMICLIYFQKLWFVAQFDVLPQGVCVNGNDLSNLFSKTSICCLIWCSAARCLCQWQWFV